MLGDNYVLSPLNQIAAKIQTRIATFLLLKDTLVQLSKNESVVISERAKSLFESQTKLEGDLATVLGDIEKFKQGSWTFSDITSLTTFYYQMESHIKDVKDLQQQASGVAPSGSGWLTWLPWVVIIGIPVALLTKAGKIFKGGR